MKLYGYWRSNAAFRVRIALNIKGIGHETAFVDLDKGGQHDAGYRGLNPLRVVPTLVDGGEPLTQSMAIIEYLDETQPEPPLMPPDAAGRARVRSISGIAAADTHPLTVPRVRAYLKGTLDLDDDRVLAWIRHWYRLGLEAIEAVLASSARTGRYCHGDSVTMADICLFCQVATARRYGVDLSPYPVSVRIFDACAALPAFDKALPMKQPDAPSKRG